MYCLVGIAATAVTATTRAYIAGRKRVGATRITEAQLSSAVAAATATATTANGPRTRSTTHESPGKRPAPQVSLLGTTSQCRLLARRLQTRLLQHTTERLRFQTPATAATLAAGCRTRSIREYI